MDFILNEGLNSTEILINVIVLLVPVILAALYGKRYNFLHGIIAYFFYLVLLVGAVTLCDVIADKVSGFADINTKVEGATNYLMVFGFQPLYIAAKEFKMEDMVKAKSWQLYTIVFVVFFVCQLIASKLRRKRIDKYGN